MKDDLEERLAAAESRIAAGECHIARQRDVVALLAAAGQDARAASQLLVELQVAQKVLVDLRDRLRHERDEPGS